MKTTRPVDEPAFKRALKNILNTKPKLQSEMKLGAKAKAKRAKSPAKKRASSKPKNA